MRDHREYIRTHPAFQEPDLSSRMAAALERAGIQIMTEDVAAGLASYGQAF